MTVHTLNLRSITPMATKVHVIVQIFIGLTWMCDTIELVQHVTYGITQRRCEDNSNSSPVTYTSVTHSTWPSGAMWRTHAPTFNKFKV